jgi:hypothetical protein
MLGRTGKIRCFFCHNVRNKNMEKSGASPTPNKKDESYLIIPEEKSKESILDSENFKDEKTEKVVTFGSRVLEEEEEKAAEENKKNDEAYLIIPEEKSKEPILDSENINANQFDKNEKEDFLVIPEEKSKEHILDSENFKDGEKEETHEQKKARLKDEIKSARKAYAEKDYETTNLLTRIKKKLGFVKIENKGVDSDKDLYLNYKNKVNELMSFELEKLRGEGLDGSELKKQMGQLFKNYTWDEKTELYEARTNARAEVRKGKWGEWIAKKSSDFINKYRQVNWKYKVALGVTLIAGGFNGVFVAGVGYGAMTVYRAFSGAVAGVGTVATLEALHRRKKIKNYEKNLEKLFADNENFSNKDKIDALYGSLFTEIRDYDKSLENEKRKAYKRKKWGALVGITIGSGALSMAVSKLGIGHWIMGKLGYADVPEIQSHAPKGVANNPGIESPENLKAGFGKGSVLTIKEGSNPWETAQEYYEKSKGMSPKEANNAVGNLFEKYEHQHGTKVFDDVPAGYKMTIGENGSLEFPDKHAGYLGKTVPISEHVPEVVPEIPEMKLAGAGTNININPDDPSIHAKMMESINKVPSEFQPPKVPTGIDSPWELNGAETPVQNLSEIHLAHTSPDIAIDPSDSDVHHGMMPGIHETNPADINSANHHLSGAETAGVETNIAEIGGHVKNIINGNDIHGVVDKYLEMEHQSMDRISQMQDYINETAAKIKEIEINGGNHVSQRIFEENLSKGKIRLAAEKVNLDSIRGYRNDFFKATDSLRKSLGKIFGVENWSDIKDVTVDNALKTHPEIADQLSGISHSEEEAIENFTRRLAAVAASKK